MRYTTEYQPPISETCQTFIGNNITPSIENENTAIYSLDYVLESLEEEISQNKGEEIFGIEIKDIQLLKQLYTENVSYIEF